MKTKQKYLNSRKFAREIKVKNIPIKGTTIKSTTLFSHKDSRKFAREIKQNDLEEKAKLLLHKSHKITKLYKTKKELEEFERLGIKLTKGKIVKGGNNEYVGSAMGYSYK